MKLSVNGASYPYEKKIKMNPYVIYPVKYIPDLLAIYTYNRKYVRFQRKYKTIFMIIGFLKQVTK